MSDLPPTAIIRHAQQIDMIDEDGVEMALSMLPALSDAEIEDFGNSLPCPVPAEIRELLAFTRGFSGSAVDLVDFTGRDLLFEQEDVFPNGLPIASDGFGNFWVVDLHAHSKTFGPIYFACHDAPVILLQSASLTEFLTELIRMCVPPHTSLIDDVHEDRLFHVWTSNPGVMDQATCQNSRDEGLRTFASTLDSNWLMIDLRNAEPGMGFSWGRYGPRTRIQRFGTEPIFAYQKRGFLSRLFGR